MPAITNIDLSTDPLAEKFVKNEIVDVAFAKSAGQLLSREGTNRFQVGDALITGSTGDQWSVSSDRFHAKYVAAPPVIDGSDGSDGKYQAKPVAVFARQMSAKFTVARSAGGDLLQGLANDWLLQYAPGDYGVVENSRFQRVYRRHDA